MKTQTQAETVGRAPKPLKALRTRPPAKTIPKPVDQPAKAAEKVSPQLARYILISLMFPGMITPLTVSMSRVALPILRDDFQISADMTAWVATAYTLPFMVLMSVYGRLSDGLGKRRLILAGIVIFSIGTGLTLSAASLPWLIAGRVIQGIGAAGLMPLGMAIISTIYQKGERGKALGTWSSVGPATGFLSPLAAGFLVDHLGWRAAFAPPLAISLLAFLVIFRVVPAGLSRIKPGFLRTFDWVGVILLMGAVTNFLFYLSSRPITGVAPLRDWRLLALTVVLLVSFLIWEKRRLNPFVDFGLFANRMFTLASISGAMRMTSMAGIGFLVPLYLVDVRDFNAASIGGMMMINAGAMTLMVRFGGLIADRWGSRWPTTVGLGVQSSVMLIFSQLPGTISLWVVAAVIAYHGLGAGLVLAALHHAALGHVSEEQMGAAAGLYSMIRFAGAVIGTALGGVILQNFLDQAMPVLEAYQFSFLFFAGSALIGSIVGFRLRRS